MRVTMDRQRDWQDGHQISQDESGFLQRLSRCARNRESRGVARRTQAANSAAAAVAVGGGHEFGVRRIFSSNSR